MESLTQNSLVVSALSHFYLPPPLNPHPPPYPYPNPPLATFVCVPLLMLPDLSSWKQLHFQWVCVRLLFFWKAPRCVFLRVSAHPSLENHLERRPTFTCGTHIRTARECYHEKTLTCTHTDALNDLKIPSTYCMPNGIPFQFRRAPSPATSTPFPIRDTIAEDRQGVN